MKNQLLNFGSKISFSKVFFLFAFPFFLAGQSPVEPDQNNTSFIVSGGNLSYPFYTLTFESNGSVVDFESYPLRKGNTYTFKPGSISASHPFNIGASHNVASAHATGGPLDQNSANNGQRITVSIPNDFVGTLSYFCTVHASMNRTFTILEPNPVDTNGTNFLPVYDLNSTHLYALTSAQGVVLEGNYSIVEELNSTNNPEIRIRPMFFSGGNWQFAGPNQFYNSNQNIQSMQDVEAYLQSQNLYPVNEPQGYPIYDLNTTQLTNLTNGAANQAGHYAVIDVNESFVDLEPVQQDDNGSWIVTPADDYVDLVPSRFSDINATKAWFDANASAPVAFLPFDNNHSQPGDHNQSNPGSGPNDHNGSGHLAVYDFNSSHLLSLLPPSTSAPEGNYSIIDYNSSFKAVPMEFVNGQWQQVQNGTSYPLFSNAFSSWQQVNWWLQYENLDPLNGSPGHPIYDFNTTQVTYLTNDAENQAGHYAVVDVNQSHVDLEPVYQDANGSWVVTPADDYTNLVPARFADLNATMAWLDANASPPVAHMPFDNNHSQTGDQNQSNPGSSPNDHNGSGHLAVFDFNSSHLFQLTGSESAPEGNYSIVEQDDGQGGTYLTALPMQFTNGQWQEDSQGIPYPLDSQAFPVMQDVDAFLQSQNLYPVNEPQGYPIYDLNTTQVTNLTNGAANQAGHYAVVDVNESFVDLEPVQQDNNGSWVVTPADDYVNLVPSRFSDINATKAWFDANASAPVASLPFDNNHSQPGDHNQSNPGSSPNDHNGSGHLAVFDFNSSHLFQLTGSESAPEGNYSIVEQDDGQGGTYLTALPMQFNNGQWQENSQGIPYPLDSQAFPVMQDVDAFLQSQNLYPVNEPQGHPIYDLNSTQVTNLTNGAENQAGHYAVVDVNQSSVDLEPVQQDANGSWVVTPADDYTNLVPARFADLNATKAWFDANASAPVAFLPFDNNHSQPGDHNQSNPGSGPNDHNGSGHLAVYDFNSSHLFQLTGSESAPEGNYSIVEQDDGQGGTYLTALPMQFTNGQWQEDSQGIPYPLDSQAFPVMQDVDAFLQSQNLYPVNEPQGYPIYDLNTTQVTNLTNGAANQAGHFAVVDANESFVDLEPVQQDGNGSWVVTPADDYVNLVPSRFSDINATKAWFDANASAPVAFLPFDNNHSQPGGDHNQSNPGGDPSDHNGTDPGTDGDHNGTQGLPVFALTMNQAETLIDGYAPAGSYAVEIFMDYQTGIEQRLLVSAIQLDGEWEREFDAIGNPVESPISTAHFPTADAIYQYIGQQNLEPIGYIIEQHDHNGTDPGGDYNGTDPGTGGDHNGTQGLPVFALTMNQAETLIDGYAPAGSYAVEIFMDYQTGIEQRLLVSAIQLDGEWEREFDAIGNPVESPISTAHFPTADAIYQYIGQQNLEPIGYIIEQHDHNGTHPGGDYNGTDPGTGGDHNGTHHWDDNGSYPQESPTTHPLLTTLSNPNIEISTFRLNGIILSDGNNNDLVIGFQVSDSIFFNQSEEIIVEGDFGEGDIFEASFDFSHITSNRIYFRAFARNSVFESFGSKKRAKIPAIEAIPQETLFPDANALEGGWKENWLGVFQEYPNGWVYHLDLGWCFASPDNVGGIWLWTQLQGWLWTNEQAWPYLYKNDTSSWMYLLRRQSGSAVMYDHLHGYFMHLHY